MGEVHYLDNVTRLVLPPARILERAAAADLESVVVIGWGRGEDGEFFFASSEADGPEVLWLLELARRELLASGDVT